jgi:hypothetical protein
MQSLNTKLPAHEKGLSVAGSPWIWIKWTAWPLTDEQTMGRPTGPSCNSPELSVQRQHDSSRAPRNGQISEILASCKQEKHCALFSRF